MRNRVEFAGCADEPLGNPGAWSLGLVTRLGIREVERA